MGGTFAAKATLSVTGAAIGSAFGGSGWLVLIFIGCAAIDWLTGSLRSLKKGAWSSCVAREGLWHKTGEFISVGVAALLDIVLHLLSQNSLLGDFSYTPFLLSLVSVWYICTELGSIVENIGEMGAAVPVFLSRAIEILRDKTESSGKEDKNGR